LSRTFVVHATALPIAGSDFCTSTLVKSAEPGVEEFAAASVCGFGQRLLAALEEVHVAG
jgi:hypothetical protein